MVHAALRSSGTRDISVRPAEFHPPSPPQWAKFSAMLAAILPDNAFQNRKLAASGIHGPGDLPSPEDFARIPFTTKDELLADQEARPPYGTNLTHPLARYCRLHQSSGSRGRPLRWLDTPESWDWLMRLWGLIYQAAGIRPDDRFFFPFSFGPFLGFWAGFEAAARRGHLTLAGGGMSTPARLRFLLDNQATVIGCTPTYALHMAETARAEGIDLASSPVRALIVAGEPGGSIPATKARIESAWGARCFDHTGMTEIGSLGYECVENPGGVHLNEDECIAELIDPAAGQPVPPGTRGELVLTNLGRWGSPLIRYRTGDLAEADSEPCPCGRSHIRLRGGILGRADDMVLIRGNNVHPSALEAVLRRFPEIGEYRAEVSRRSGLAVLRLEIETAPGGGSNGTDLAGRVESAVKDALNFKPEAAVVPAGTLPRFEMKSSRFHIHPSFREEPS